LFTHLIGIDRERFLYILELCFSLFLLSAAFVRILFSLLDRNSANVSGGKIIDG
jgi:hypothetical protein